MNQADEVFKWDEEQIEAYAIAFREGDAVYVEGRGWHKIEPCDYTTFKFYKPSNCGMVINKIPLEEYYEKTGYKEGFNGSYKIIMPKDYEAKDGDKLVWLGKTNDFLTFGKVYEASGAVSMLGTHYTADDGSCRFIAPLAVKYWGVIPKWENVKEEEKIHERK